MLNGHSGVYTIIYIIPLINNGFHSLSPTIPILKFMIKQVLTLSAEYTVWGGSWFIITECRLSRLSRQARGGYQCWDPCNPISVALWWHSWCDGTTSAMNAHQWAYQWFAHSYLLWWWVHLSSNQWVFGGWGRPSAMLTCPLYITVLRVLEATQAHNWRPQWRGQWGNTPR